MKNGQVKSRAAPQASEYRFRLIVDSIPGFVCTFNAAGEVEHLNRQILEYFGKTTEELKNWAMSDAVHPDDLPSVIEMWRHAVENGEPYDFELRRRRADGVSDGSNPVGITSRINELSQSPCCHIKISSNTPPEYLSLLARDRSRNFS